MSVAARRIAQSGEHWAAEEHEESSDLIVFLVPPVPNYAAPPPPVSSAQSPARPAESSHSSMSVRSVANIYEHAAPCVEAPKPPIARLPAYNAPAVPPKPAPSTPKHPERPLPPHPAPHGAHNGLAQSATTLQRPAPPTKPTASLHTPAHSSAHAPPSPNLANMRHHPLSNTVAALPSVDGRKTSMPPLPVTTAASRPTRATTIDMNYKPMMLVPVLPVGASAGNGNVSPRELLAAQHAQSASTSNLGANNNNNHYHQASLGSQISTQQTQSLSSLPTRSNSTNTHGLSHPSMLSSSTSMRLPSNGRDRSNSKGGNGEISPRGDSISPGGTVSGITAPSRPSLRVDDSISDNRVIQEMVITHEDYVADLCLILSVFALPMKERSIVPLDVHTIFFEGLENLISVEQNVLRDMKIRNRLKPMDMAMIFQTHLSALKVYIPFCARQDRALKLMTEQLASNSEFAKFCEEVRKEPACRGLSFDAFIIKPLQRLCKLPLLFREIGKTVSAENGGAVTEERRKVEATQFQLEQILDEINKTTGDADKLLELERNLIKKYPQIESLSLQYRKLLLTGEIAWVVKATKDQVKLRLGTFWLLDQVLLFCRSPKELDFIMPLNTVSISKHLPAVQNFPYVLELSDMTAQGLVTRKLCSNDLQLYNNLIQKLS